MRVAYLGPAGTHSEEALRASAPADAEAIPYPTIYDAVMAVQEGAVDRAIVPIENALEGSVAITLDTLTLEAGRVRIEAEVVQPVHHCVIAPSEISLSTVERVVSHPQATAQCARFLREHIPNAEHVSAPSTADAVTTVCRAGDGASVALGSSLAADLYDCYIVATNVEDHPDNVTRFVWLAPEDRAGGPGEDPKTSIVFWGGGDESPGWLVDVLNEFAGREVNLTRIESRPRRTGLGHYFFFVDLEGATGSGRVDEALDAVRGHVEELRVLGSYGRPPWLN
ncbi:MAG TPA: prephenate dehydratase [Thermoleophilaceae bacterium]|nr:prephenate dehydratase [Thermoleophilaceae bacterium]